MYILHDHPIHDLFRLSHNRAAQSIAIIKRRRSSVLPTSSPIPPAAECNTCETKPESCLLHRAAYLQRPAAGGRRPAAGQSLDITRKSSSSMFIDPKAVSLCHKNDRGTWGVPDRLWCSASVHLRMSEHGPVANLLRHHYVVQDYLPNG